MNGDVTGNGVVDGGGSRVSTGTVLAATHCNDIVGVVKKRHAIHLGAFGTKLAITARLIRWLSRRSPAVVLATVFAMLMPNRSASSSPLSVLYQIAAKATAHKMLAVTADGKVALVDLKRFHQGMMRSPKEGALI